MLILVTQVTPILDNTKKNGCAHALKELIPPGSIINSYAFYDGKLEFSLADDKRFVNAHTSSTPVYVFWACLMHDPERLYSMVSSDCLRFEGEAIFSTLQDMWHQHSSPFIRASLFYIMNRCSSTGLISSGELDQARLTATAMAKLKIFKVPESFHLNLSPMSLEEQINKADSQSYNLIPAGHFNYNLFEAGKNVAIEETSINHRQLINLCKNKENKLVITYDYNEKILSAFRKNRIVLVDKYGRKTEHKERAEEIIVANF